MAINENANVNVNVNGEGAEEQLSVLQKQAKKFRLEMEKANKAGDIKGFKNAEKEFKAVNKQARQLAKNTFDVDKVMRNLSSAGPKEINRAIRELNKKLNDGSVKRGSAEWKKYTKQIRLAKTEQSKIRAEINGTTKATSKWMNMAKGLLPAIGFAALAAGAKRLFSNMINVRKEFEKYEAILTNSLGSNRAARKELSMLSDFAAKTPFQLNELTGAFVKLTNYGLKPNREELRKYGDVASSVGKSFDQYVEAIADATQFEFERLKEFGIRAKKEGDTIKFTFKGITTEVDANAKSVQQYMASLGDMEGVAGSMEAISKTMEGASSNLGDAVDRLFNKIGSGGLGQLYTNILRGITKLVGNIAGATDKVSEKLSKETTEVNLLVIELTNANTAAERRNEIYKILKEINPDIVDGIDAENISVEKLRLNLAKYNEEMIKQIALQDSKEALEDTRNEYGKLIGDRMAKEIELSELLLQNKEDAAKWDKEASEHINNILLSDLDILEKEKQIYDIIQKKNIGVRFDLLARDLASDILNLREKEKVKQEEINDSLEHYMGMYEKIMDNKTSGINPDPDGEVVKTIKSLKDELTLLKDARESINVEDEEALRQNMIMIEQLNELIKKYEDLGRAQAGEDIDVEVPTFGDLEGADENKLTEMEALAASEVEIHSNKLDQIELRESGYGTAIADKEKWLTSERLKQINIYGDSAMRLIGAIQMMQHAAMTRELKAAGDNEKKKDEIRKKYAKKQQTMAIIQAIINTALGVTNALATLPPPASFVAAAVTAIAGAVEIAAISSQQFATGRYPVMGAQDGQIYSPQQTISRPQTGIVKGPALISEVEDEMIIDGPTTRNLVFNYPEIVDGIKALSMGLNPQFADGRYPQSTTEIRTETFTDPLMLAAIERLNENIEKGILTKLIANEDYIDTHKEVISKHDDMLENINS